MVKGIRGDNHIANINSRIQRSCDSGIDQHICLEPVHKYLGTDASIDFADSASNYHHVLAAQFPLAENHRCLLYRLLNIHIFLQCRNFFFHCSDNSYHINLSSLYHDYSM